MDRDSYKRLKRDPRKWKRAPLNLFCNAEIMNFYTQYTYRGENVFEDYKFLPTRTELIDDIKARMSMEKDSGLRNDLAHHGSKILEAACIDATVFGDRHFSKVWLMNPQSCILRSHFGAKSTPLTPRAAIVIINPLESFQTNMHDPEKLAQKMRRLLNHLDAYYNKSGGKSLQFLHHAAKSAQRKVLSLSFLQMTSRHSLSCTSSATGHWVVLRV